MVTQYPNTITITTATTAAKNNGNWTPGSSTETEVMGRYEPNSGNGYITTADGEKYVYDGIVYFPLPLDAIAPGSKVVVKNGAEVLLQNTVKKFSAGQLNARVWL